MATTGIDICSPYGMACTECNDLLVAPKWSAYVSKREVRHFGIVKIAVTRSR